MTTPSHGLRRGRGSAVAAPPKAQGAPEVLRGRAQDCGSCPFRPTCWGAPSARARALNFLICRFQRNIAKDASFKSILRLLEPLIDAAAAKLASVVRDELGAPSVMSTARAEILGVVAEACAMFPLGGDVWPTAWIFRSSGAYVRSYITQRRVLAKQARARERVRLADLDDEMLLQLGLVDRIMSDPADEEQRQAEHGEMMVAHLLEVIDDGHTLSTAEYRVVAFYLRGRNGRQGTGVAWLAKTLEVPRPYVSRLWARAFRRVVAAAGLREDYLRSLGLTVREGATSREEIIRLLSQPSAATIEDVAFALGVSDQRVYGLARETRQAAQDARDADAERERAAAAAARTAGHAADADGVAGSDASAPDGQLRRRGVRSRERSLAVTRLPRAPGARARKDRLS